jgi:hypothetical protein
MKNGKFGAISVNNFYTDLEYSLEERENELFDNFYFRVIPNLERVEIINDLSLQKEGIDKKLILKNGKIILIDEKKRRKNYGDILLEEYSDYDKKKVGWIGLNKQTDYIIYAIMPSKKVYLIPFLLLQKAWKSNYHNWMRIYGRKFAPNKYYVTSNIPVPVNVLIEALSKEMNEQLSIFN